MSYARLDMRQDNPIVYELGPHFRVYFAKKSPKRFTTFLACKNAYFPISYYEYEMQLKHWLDSFTRQMMCKGEVYTIGQFLSLTPVQKNQEPYLRCTIIVEAETGKQEEYEIYLDMAECYVIARAIQHLYSASRSFLHFPWE